MIIRFSMNAIERIKARFEFVLVGLGQISNFGKSANK